MVVWHPSENDLLKDMERRKQKEEALRRCGISDCEDEEDTAYCHACKMGEFGISLRPRLLLTWHVIL